MSDNVQKYENWRAITESDYVTMFIKTCFAFVATLRELYPKENLNDVIGKGDKVFLNPYLDDFQAVFPSKVLARFNSLTLSINADFVLALAQMKDPNIQKENLLFSQAPCSNFIYKVEDGADVPDPDTYKWFLNSKTLKDSIEVYRFVDVKELMILLWRNKRYKNNTWTYAKGIRYAYKLFKTNG